MRSQTRYVITGGSAYTDIDVFACAIGYQDLLRLFGKSADAVLPAPFNITIPPIIENQEVHYQKTYQRQVDDKFILVDVSDPNFFPEFVNEDKIVELYDHHFGHENYWANRLGNDAHIEVVGSCATLIWELYVAHSMESKISPATANVLYAGIVANTLNLQAQITSDRDRLAERQLKRWVSLPAGWQEVYYSQVNTGVEKNLVQAIKNDLKTVSISGEDYKIAQVELWNAKEFATSEDIRAEVRNAFNGDYWFLIISSIEEGINYLISTNRTIQKELQDLINARWVTDELGITDMLWMRKEILREYQKQLSLNLVK